MGPRLELLPGGRRASGRFGPLRIVVAREDDPPFAVDAAAFEEDTWLALSTISPVVRSPGHPVRVMTSVWESEPETPGSVIVKAGSPLRLLAVVHDLNADPTWTEEWVATALRGIFREADDRGVEALMLPLIGTRHGKLPAPRFMALLRSTLEELIDNTPEGKITLRRIWLVREDESGEGLLRSLGADQEPSRNGA